MSTFSVRNCGREGRRIRVLPSQYGRGGGDSGRPMADARECGWWARQDSNLQPDGYEPSALTIELHARHAPRWSGAVTT